MSLTKVRHSFLHSCLEDTNDNQSPKAMAPRKETLSDAQLRDIRKEHGIRMRGPVPPKHWPREHKHHFQAVRTIGDLHYETYRDDAAISSKQRKIYRQRAKRLWIKAYDLLEDVAANESTWRVLEAEIFEVFDRDLIWCASDLQTPCNNIDVPN
jgi:hypothetical protein